MRRVEHNFDSTQAEQYLSALFEPSSDSLIELRPIAPDADGATKGTFHDSVPDVLRAVEKAAQRGMNVFVGVAPRRTAANGKKTNLRAAPALWIDFDGDLAELDRLLQPFQFKPSLVVHTGGGAHVYWKLEEPFALDTEEQITRFECALKGR